MNETTKLSYEQILMDGIQDRVFIIRVGDDANFYYDFLNCAAMEGTGLTLKVIGKSIRYIYPKPIAEYLVNQYNKVVTSLKCITYEYSYESADGHTQYLKTRLTPLFDKSGKCTHVVELAQDVTEKVKLLKQYKESNDRFRIIAENAHDLITLINVKGEIIYVSPSYKKILGFDHKEFIGKLFFHNIHPDDKSNLEVSISNSIKNGQPCKVQFKQKHRTKGWIWSESHGTPVFDDQSKFLHMVFVTRDITLRTEYESELKYYAYHDSLTELPNRRLFKEYLTRALRDFQDKGIRFALFIMDIDQFKSINDQMGHDVGDKVIAEFGKRVKSNIRDTDLVARLGGDEFVILLPKISADDSAVAIAKKVQMAMAEPWCIDEYVLKITTSIGIALTPLQGKTPYSMLKSADEALYKVKEMGGNTYKVNSSMI